ncbi:MAG: glycosyltransferase [Treponema sp.]|nr:glycosyltransferase [Treponema sp.]
MNSEIKVSIIVPVYNKEKFLDCCLQSIIKQTLKEIEIIIINDGSNDNSKKIIEKYEGIDNRIYIINKTNEGGGIARNEGIKIARGEYLGFVDADDWIDLNYYEILYNHAVQRDADLARTLQKRYYPGSIEELPLNKKIIEKYSKNELLNKNDHAYSVLTAIYKRKMIIDNNILFDTLQSSHDKLFTVKAMYYSNLIIPVIGTYYHHRDDVIDQLTIFNSRRLINDNLANMNIIKFVNSVEYNDINEYKQLFKKILYVCDYNFKKAIKEKNVDIDTIKQYFSGMLNIYKNYNYKDNLFYNYKAPYIKFLINENFMQYYNFYNKKRIRFNALFDKIRRKIIKIIFGSELYDNFYNIKHIYENIKYIKDIKDIKDIVNKSNTYLIKYNERFNIFIKERDNYYNKINNLLIENKKINSEILWANIFNNTIQDSYWLNNKTFSPGRWAAGYAFLYILYRIIKEVQPMKILELGLGETTRMISQYAMNNENVEHYVVENNTDWIEFFIKNFNIPHNTKIIQLPLKYQAFEESESVRVYEGFYENLSNNKYDLISIDGPVGGDMKEYSRIDSLSLIPENLSNDFIILIDDYNRNQEKNMVKKLLEKIEEAGIPFYNTVYKGSKETCIICCQKYKFLTSL